MVEAVEILVHVTQFSPHLRAETPAGPGKGAVLSKTELTAVLTGIAATQYLVPKDEAQPGLLLKRMHEANQLSRKETRIVTTNEVGLEHGAKGQRTDLGG